MRIALSRRRARILTAAWAAFMLVLTSWPSPPEVPVVSAIPDVDKMVHGVLYAVLGFLVYFSIAWPGERRRLFWRAITVAGAIAVWGTLDEIHQAWIPGRSMELGDAFVDAVAGFAGALAAARWSVSRRHASRAPAPSSG
jgi:VanZ family protein